MPYFSIKRKFLQVVPMGFRTLWESTKTWL